MSIKNSWLLLNELQEKLNELQQLMAEATQAKTVHLQHIIDEYHPYKFGDVVYTEHGIAFTADHCSMCISEGVISWRVTGPAADSGHILEKLIKVEGLNDEDESTTTQH